MGTPWDPAPWLQARTGTTVVDAPGQTHEGPEIEQMEPGLQSKRMKMTKKDCITHGYNCATCAGRGLKISQLRLQKVEIEWRVDMAELLRQHCDAVREKQG